MKTALLVVLIVGMAVSGALLILRTPAFFSPDGGGDPVTAVQLAVVFVVFAIGARVVRSVNAE